MTEPSVSVVIPTFNRPDRLANLLASLAGQTLPHAEYEVIIIDDGSAVSYTEVLAQQRPFAVRYDRQANGGEGIARNRGVTMARADFIVFLDDDMTVVPDYVAALLAEHRAHPDDLLLGNMWVPAEDGGTVFQRVIAGDSCPGPAGEVPFTAMAAGVLALSRTIYEALGGMEPFPDPKRGVWMDLAFAYRAHTLGHGFRRCGPAIAYHHDYTMTNHAAHAQRMYRVSLMAPLAFRLLPGLRHHVAMFHDKGPIEWRGDPPRLIARKAMRAVLSAGPTVALLEGLCAILERHYPRPAILQPLYRWIAGGYIYRGYRDGLRSLATD